MKLSRFILNSESATLAEVGVVDISLTIPANFTANAVRETVVPSPIKNDSTIALACMTTDGRSVTGTSATTIHAKVHLFESPFEA